MKWIHLNECDSTQKYLIDLWEKSDKSSQFSMVISASQQNLGVGRSGNSWQHFAGSLAFSFTLSPLNPATLTPLEIGLQLVLFFNEKFQTKLTLKWPNDLFNQKDEKCGGIIVNQLSPHLLAVGVGLNLWNIPSTKLGKNLIGPIFEKETIASDEHHQLPFTIAKAIEKNRINEFTLKKDWCHHCFHVNRSVKIESGHQIFEGNFVGIGELGEALIKTTTGEISPVYSGSLFLLD